MLRYRGRGYSATWTPGQTRRMVQTGLAGSYQASSYANKAVAGAVAAGVTAALVGPKKKGKSLRQRKSKTSNTFRTKSLRSELRKIKTSMNKDMATHTHRKRVTSRLLNTQNVATYSSHNEQSQSTIEAAMAAFRYYNPAVPGTLTTADASTGTYSRDIYVKSITSKLTIRNNYQIPCRIKVYCVRPKSDTNVTGLTQFTNGMTDQGNPSAASPLIHLTDSDQFNEQYSIVKSIGKVLAAGQICSLSHYVKPFYYDPSNYDSHTLAYQTKFKAFQFIVRLEGVLAHDTAADEQGFSNSGIDILVDTKWVFQYDAGVNLNDFSIADSSDSFTNAAVITNKPVADNQTYSLA